MKKQRLSSDPSIFGSFILLSANSHSYCVSKPYTLTESLGWRSFSAIGTLWGGGRCCSCLFHNRNFHNRNLLPGSVQFFQPEKDSGLSLYLNWLRVSMSFVTPTDMLMFVMKKTHICVTGRLCWPEWFLRDFPDLEWSESKVSRLKKGARC